MNKAIARMATTGRLRQAAAVYEDLANAGGLFAELVELAKDR